MVGIIDYGMGNLRSVEKSLQSIGAETCFIKTPQEMEAVKAVVLPGVGAFGDCVKNIQKSGLWHPIKNWVKVDRPFLGICLGYQVLFEESEESPEQKGLGVFGGKVRRFEGDLKIPQMGWNQIQLRCESLFLKNVEEGSFVYFVHSYYPEPTDSSCIALTTNYGVEFASAITRGNLFATQFHPEKSQTVGLQILKNFVHSFSE